MQIAQIVPKVRTQKEAVFDYRIPPELLPQIRPGILVEIPFHGRKLEGIVVNLKRSSPISHLSSLISVIDPIPVTDKTHIELAQWMSGYYLDPLGKTLFENIIPPAKRTIKKINPTQYLSATAANRSLKSNNYLILADFPTRLKFYLKTIQKTYNQNRSTIILIPDLSHIPYFTKYLKYPIVIFHASMTKTERWLEWDKIRHGKSKIVIGSNSTLFAPAKNLGLIIIDQEENATYKNDRSPRFHAVTVAERLSRLTNANLVIGSVTPRIETYYQATQGRYYFIKKQSVSKSAIIVDMNSEKYVISNTLEKEIENALQNKKRILLVLNRKGEGTKFSCPDCGWIAYCEKCGLSLVPQNAENICFRCEKKYLQPTACERCQGIHLRPTGLGTARLKKFLTDLFPKAKVIQIEKEIDDRQVRSNWDIAITTSYGLKFNWPKIDLMGIIDADQGLNFPDFNSAQKTFQTLYKFLRIGERGIIQTHLPENSMIKSLAKLDYERFFLEEISQRRKFGFPPFVKLIRLLYKNVDEEKSKKETLRVYKLLATSRYPFITISQPHPAFIEKERGKFRYQIVIKLPIAKHQIPNNIRNIFRALPKNWAVDVDPVNLL